MTYDPRPYWLPYRLCVLCGREYAQRSTDPLSVVCGICTFHRAPIRPDQGDQIGRAL